MLSSVIACYICRLLCPKGHRVSSVSSKSIFHLSISFFLYQGAKGLVGAQIHTLQSIYRGYSANNACLCPVRGNQSTWRMAKVCNLCGHWWRQEVLTVPLCHPPAYCMFCKRACLFLAIHFVVLHISLHQLVLLIDITLVTS